MIFLIVLFLSLILIDIKINDDYDITYIYGLMVKYIVNCYLY